MNSIIPTSNESPFDAIRQVREDGTEFWSARDLMPLLGYVEWRKFEGSVDRARMSADAQGVALADHFGGAAKVIEGGRWGSQTVADFDLSRFACYLVAMNGDPRKPEVAAAQAYFAIRTREAETARPQQMPTHAEALRGWADEVERRVLAEQRAAELEVPAAAWDHLAAATGDYSVSDAAKILSRGGVDTGARRLFKTLERIGWAYHRGGHWQAMQAQVDLGRLAMRFQPPRYHPVTGEQFVNDPQVRITAKGIAELHRRLGGTPAYELDDAGEPRLVAVPS